MMLLLLLLMTEMLIMMIENVGEGDGLISLSISSLRESFGLHPIGQLKTWHSSLKQ